MAKIFSIRATRANCFGLSPNIARKLRDKCRSETSNCAASRRTRSSKRCTRSPLGPVLSCRLLSRNHCSLGSSSLFRQHRPEADVCLMAPASYSISHPITAVCQQTIHRAERNNPRQKYRQERCDLVRTQCASRPAGFGLCDRAHPNSGAGSGRPFGIVANIFGEDAEILGQLLFQHKSSLGDALGGEVRRTEELREHPTYAPAIM
jgi:hypothetical protein